MHCWIMVVVLCVCLSVNSLTATHLVCESQAQCYDSLCCFKRMYCVDFAENALFSSSGDIYSGPLPSTIGPSFQAPWQLFDGQNEQQ